MTLDISKKNSFRGASNPNEMRPKNNDQSCVGSPASCASSVSFSEVMEPPDWEELSGKFFDETDPLCYPNDDVIAIVLPRKIRTVDHVLPDEDLNAASLYVRDCIECYTSDWSSVEYKYRCYSSSLYTREKLNERIERLQSANLRHQYEVDIDPMVVSASTDELSFQQCDTISCGRQSVTSSSSSSSCNETLTLRDSRASLDLRSTNSDPLLQELIDGNDAEGVPVCERANEIAGLYSPYLFDDYAPEKRLPADLPFEPMGHRILVTCHQLKLDLELEPIFASMALFDARERKKISENFYFNMNSENIKQMLSSHIPNVDLSTLSRSAVFDIMNPTSDLFLVIRLEKVLQGDINECIEPYIKDDKNREKVRASAAAACSRLGKYRMAFAWTAVSITTILNGSNNLDRGDQHSDKDNISIGSTNSLERKSSTEGVRRVGSSVGSGGGILSRKGSLERRPQATTSISNDDLAQQLHTFRPITITLASFFKQESDRLRDEDLYKFLQEIKRPSSAPKKLKCIPGILKLEIQACNEDIKNGLSPELVKLQPYSDENARPCKEILPFPQSPILLPHYQYRNLLYVNPRELNFSSYTSKSGSARNIAIRIQLMAGEDQSSAMNSIFGRSSCPEFSTEAYSIVTYHNKAPTFYDEIKIKLPATLSDQHHLFFTFYHISCQRKPPASPEQDKPVETPIGYSWLPLCRSGHLTSGDWHLPLMQEPPPPNYSYIFPDVQLPGTKWHDNHKPLFSLTVNPFSTVHPMDAHIERFATAYEALESGNIPARIGVANMDSELRNSLLELGSADPTRLVQFLPVLAARLSSLLARPPTLHGQVLNVAQDAFHALLVLFKNITSVSSCDSHDRSSLLTTYIQYQHKLPKPMQRFEDQDVGLPIESYCKVLHEELVLQWVVASGNTRELAMQNSWSLCELIVKTMVEHLARNNKLNIPRKDRFPEQFIDNVTTLVNNITSEIISRYGRDGKLTQSINNSLAFFLFDLLSVMDRGYVFGLIRSYYKQMSAKVASLPDAVPLIHYKVWFLRIICSHEHYVSLCVGSCNPHTTLSPHYRRHHFLSGLLLVELAQVLRLPSPTLHAMCACAVASICAAHESDPRLVSQEARARVAALYLPILQLLIDVHPQLYKGTKAEKDKFQLNDEIDQIGCLYSNEETDYNNSHITLNSETTRNLLITFVWLLRWLDKDILYNTLQLLCQERLHTFLLLIDLTFSCFEYKGQKEILKCAQQNVRKTTDIKAKLGDVILGQGSARSELIMRRKGGWSSGGSCRWRKEWKSGSNSMHAEHFAPLEPALAAEVALTLANTLHILAQIGGNHETPWGDGVFAVLIRALQRNNSAVVVQYLLAAVRTFTIKRGCESWSRRRAAISVAVRGCAARLQPARSHAAATLYALLTHHYHITSNFSQVKMQVTMSLSSLVGTSISFSEEALRRSLKTVLMYSEQDQHMLESPFPEQVKDLVFNLHMILSDTVKMKEYQSDPEMLLDLMQRVAHGYRHSPHLRLTWLNSMAQKHMERGNHAEAGMCLVCGAALVAETGISYYGIGANALINVSPNTLLESRVDQPDDSEHLAKHTLQALLEHAASELMLAGMYEAVNEVYKVLIPIVEKNRDYKKLANIHGKLNEAFVKIEQLHGKRVFGTYFRVGFYGSRFGDLNGEEFIYKEPTLTKLPEIFIRLENFYNQRFGAENVVIIKDSNTVDVNTLEVEKAYIQITYVEPYFEPYELRHRVTHFERNFNIKRFVFATPFTSSGAAHGRVGEQHKRRTVLTTEQYFPALTTRVKVIKSNKVLLSPLHVAIDDIHKKISELHAATIAEPADAKMLQMVVQGCIGTAVNQGPFEMAHVFLQPPITDSLSHKLRLAFKDFCKKCRDALKKNENLIGPDQREYQCELERNFCKFVENIAPLVHMSSAHVALLCNGLCRNEWKNEI